jgi:signal transduction histidine kinase
MNRHFPSWLANLFFFGLLVGFVLASFFLQLSRIDRSMQHNAQERARLVAGIIEENLRNAELAARAIEQITFTLLGDKAKFIDYLDAVEPLNQEELAALAVQSGLAGITLIRPSGLILSGPENWLDDRPDCEADPLRIHYNTQQQTAYMIHPTTYPEGDLSCVIVGMDASRILSLKKRTDLPAMLKTLTNLPGIDYIRLVSEQSAGNAANTTSVRLVRTGNHATAEATLYTTQGMLVVGLDAQHFIQRRTSLKHQFIFFCILLLVIGFSFSWLLYRYQKLDLERTRKFERMMAREHEAATLGRATATIAHEVRNPLNAINMGLQRLTLESDNLKPEQEDLIRAMQEAVYRTSTIVTELQRFTRDLRPKRELVDFDCLLQRQVTLYQTMCDRQGIDVRTGSIQPVRLAGDPELLAELVENILKNSVEAQPDGGFIHISLIKGAETCVLRVSNSGFQLDREQAERMGAPYFTTKTRGTGLGLALCRRIAEAHGGKLSIEPEPDRKTLTIQVVLPLTAPENTAGGKK